MGKRVNKMLKAFVFCLLLVCFSITLLPTSVFAEGTEESGIKIVFDNSKTNWENVKIHYWGGKSASNWPGVDMEPVEGKENCFSITLPSDTTSILFHNGAGIQTTDITLDGEGEYIGYDEKGGKIRAVKKNEDGSIPNPDEEVVEKITILYDNSFTQWNEVYLYHYGGPAGADWPGEKMELVEGTDNLYTIQIAKGAENIIFNNNAGEQSQDINDVADNGEYIALQKEGGKVAILRKNDDGSIPKEPEFDGDESKKEPKQVNAHIGETLDSVNISFATLVKIYPKVTINKVGSSDKISFEGDGAYSFMSEKYHYSVKLTGLEPETKYEYTIGEGEYAYKGTFKTSPKEGSKETIKFAYLADPQVKRDSDAKALGSTFDALNKIDDLGFVYIAGDITDNSMAENQWDALFENAGAFPQAGKTMFGNNLIAVTQGNHDLSNFTSHITAPGEVGDAVYSFDYGPVKFIVLNLETAKTDEESRENQKAFLEKEVNKAKKAGQWTIVGFHKSIYTGASHIVDSDVIEARKYWSPVLSSLDVDLVLQGHDHVYSRGFVTAKGENANLQKNEDGSYNSNDNIPLYMVGGHAGGYKWYVPKDYTVSEGDLLTPDYEFLDVDSAKDEKQGQQSYTIFEVSNDEIKFNSYMSKYDTESDEITIEPYLYDTLTIKRETFKVNLPEVEGATVKETEDSYSPVAKGGEFKFTVGLDDEYNNSSVIVKANGNEISPVDGVYTIENVTENIDITVDGVVKNKSEENNKPTEDNNKPNEENNKPNEENNKPTEDNNKPSEENNKPNKDNNQINNSSNNNSSNNSNNGVSNSNTTSTKTGDNNKVAGVALLMIGSLALVISIAKKKKEA